MRIIWNTTERCFEAEFSSGPEWSLDQQAAKEAGFKTSGAPAWRWTTESVKALNFLKEHRPQQLTITAEALLQYNRLEDMRVKNEAVLAPLKAAKKEAQKQRVREVKEGEKTPLIIPPGKWCVDACDLPPVPLVEFSRFKPKPFNLFCSVCGDGLDNIWDDQVFMVC